VKVIYGLTIQKVGKQLAFRCLECTLLTGRLGLIQEDGPPFKLYCRVHPENYGQWNTPEEMEREKLALAARLGLR
jgi:hypothetical protein